METPTLNAHNKAEFEPAHTAEHLLNATMVKMFGCPRSRNAHVEKKKSKCDYILDAEPTAEQVAQIETKVNEVIAMGLDVTIEFVSREQAAEIVDLSKLPEDASDTLRIVRIGCSIGTVAISFLLNKKSMPTARPNKPSCLT